MKFDKISLSDHKYPPLLKQISDPPRQLYVRGKLNTDRPMIAVVGSRKITAYGRAVTEQFAGELAAAGVGIVSGLALGVDAVAHRAALEAGGYTLAVLAGGVDTISPATNRGLGEQILKRGGGIISEHPASTPPLRHHFPVRNRIVAGLSHAVIITEAREKSGALITATLALEENREVMAVPGNITSPMSAGCNNLIKSGAAAITGSADVLAALGLKNDGLRQRPLMGNEESAIYTLLEDGITDGHELQNRSGLNTAEFNQTITLMEISGKVRNLGGGQWTRM